jgi:hypothetical protein
MLRSSSDGTIQVVNATGAVARCSLIYDAWSLDGARLFAGGGPVDVGAQSVTDVVEVLPAGIPADPCEVRSSLSGWVDRLFCN